MSEQQALIEQILSGENRRLQMMAAAGMVPLGPEQLVPLQVALAGGIDPEVAQQASQALINLEPALAISYVRDHATDVELEWFGRNATMPQVVDAVIQRPGVPRDILAAMAPRLWPEAQESLLLRQDAIIEAPEILVALETNEQLSSYAKRRIWEYREHLLPRDKVPPKKPEEILAEADSWTDEEVQEAIEEARAKPVGKGEAIEGAHGLSDAQVRSLPVPARIRLARQADRALRAVMARDSNSQVAMGVLAGNRLSDQEVELFARSRSVHADILTAIAARREWVRKYSIAKALAHNPRVAVGTAMRLLSRLTLNDLRLLGRDRNVPQAIRSAGARMFKAKR